MKLILKSNALGRLLGYGACGRCGDTFNWKPWHETQEDGNRGCLPLCESCWSALTPETRLPYYRELFESWVIQDPARWNAMEAAVMAGR